MTFEHLTCPSFPAVPRFPLANESSFSWRQCLRLAGGFKTPSAPQRPSHEREVDSVADKWRNRQELFNRPGKGQPESQGSFENQSQAPNPRHDVHAPHEARLWLAGKIDDTYNTCHIRTMKKARRAKRVPHDPASLKLKG